MPADAAAGLGLHSAVTRAEAIAMVRTLSDTGFSS